MGSKTWIAGAAAITALLAAPAHAGTSITISLGTPGYYGSHGHPGYVYTQPGYVHAPPVYLYSQPRYVYSQPGYVYSRPSPGYNRYNRLHGTRYRDSDGDGVPDRFDRRPHNPYRY